MAEKTQAEKHQIIHLLQQIPFDETEKALWMENVEENGVTEELLDEMHTKLLALPQEKFASEWVKAKLSTDLARVARQWRMQRASRQFKHNR
ncbi:MAG TPA: hypothetical protein PKZ26_09680 [Anaerolineaceae bacterium]|nr:hypothetical protein [Candidatus Cloacimonadota bacterium]NMC17620.1 hypothetical protein [Chloroflexota bacterium]HNS07143.1 hypothetical protein [Anaerolineaceae bacterium]HNW13969.1 hypothetical protein [Anaerolineaceae bacterium]HOE02382.1 hypothetical protein [Anaerolineaceae bacterium]